MTDHHARLLAIETSAESCSVALCIDGEVREKFELSPRLHAERILPMVNSLLAEAGLSLKNLDAIAFGRGPGSFTSLRIGIGVVQGLAWGAELPVVPVSSLAAVAQSVLEHSPQPGITRVCVAMDARMSEVYTAWFERAEDGLMQAVSDERVCPPGVIDVIDESSACGAGNGFDRYPELVRLGEGMALCVPDCWPRASAVCRLAKGWLKHHDPLPADQAQPVYIRDKVAEKPA